MNIDLPATKKHPETPDAPDSLRAIGLKTIRDLETDRGILASDRSEIYGCIFGRDSLITSLKLLKTYERTGDAYFLSLVRKILTNLAALQGTAYNIESGEAPGKIIHEYRENNHEHLTGRAERPWYVYPDKTMKNYDSVDSTPLFLIAAARYAKAGDDADFMTIMKPHIEKAFSWMYAFDHRGTHGFVNYRFPAERTYGGLMTQSWMDSRESVFHEDGTPSTYPIAPAEVQAYAYLAYRLWGHHERADLLKERFNREFVMTESGRFVLAFGIDGNGKPMTSARSSMGHILWASLHDTSRDGFDSILEAAHIPRLVERLLAPDLFLPSAGIRTLSSLSSQFDPASYHNGSIWPHDTAIAAEGLANAGYADEAAAVRASLRQAWEHFKTPVELFVYTTDKGFGEYLSPSGQRACTRQAWSAASMLSEL